VQSLACDGIIVIYRLNADLQLVQNHRQDEGSAGSTVSFKTATLGWDLPLAICATWTRHLYRVTASGPIDRLCLVRARREGQIDIFRSIRGQHVAKHPRFSGQPLVLTE